MGVGERSGRRRVGDHVLGATRGAVRGHSTTEGI